jgi:transposase InsO family protein
VKFAFIDAEKTSFPVEFMCGELEVSRSGYYAWRRRKPSKHAVDDAELAKEIASFHAASRGTYGSPRIHEDLKGAGRKIGRKRVARLMRQQRLAARRRRRFKRTTDSSHAMPIAPNLLERDFRADRPNEVWVTDITYVWTREGWLYLAAIVDLYSRAVVGWAMSEHIDTALVLSALAMAVMNRRPPPGLVGHSDRGSQYASAAYQRALDDNGIICSMSGKGDCWDNAVAESFWSTIKAELIELCEFETRASATQAIFEYIEVFYNRQRRHSTIGYRTPAQQEGIFASASST